MNLPETNDYVAKAKWFVFLSKAAFIANIFFIFYLFFSHASFVLPQVITSVILSMGFVLSPILNITAVFALLFLLLKGQRKTAPAWLIVFNLFWLFFQLLYFILI